jgi:hypothetical protein
MRTGLWTAHVVRRVACIGLGQCVSLGNEARRRVQVQNEDGHCPIINMASTSTSSRQVKGSVYSNHGGLHMALRKVEADRVKAYQWPTLTWRYQAYWMVSKRTRTTARINISSEPRLSLPS